MQQGPQSQRVRNSLTRQAYNWLQRHKVRAFYSVVEANDLEDGAKCLFQVIVIFISALHQITSLFYQYLGSYKILHVTFTPHSEVDDIVTSEQKYL